jgi:response regulator RpfG family c-di-GMP phosphodiesterase
MTDETRNPFPGQEHLKILLAEDDPVVRHPMSQVLTLGGYSRISLAADGLEACRLLEKGRYDLLITDLEMPRMKGDELVAIAREGDPSLQVVVATGLLTRAAEENLSTRGVRRLFRKPFRLRELVQELEDVFREIAGEPLLRDRETAEVLATQREEREPFARGHHRKVADLALATGLAMDMSLRQLVSVWIGGMCADVGKAMIDPKILGKPAPLTQGEQEVVRRHPLYSGEILEPLLRNRESLAPVLEHHERIDGTGYPHCLPGDRIRPESQVVSLADVFVALGSPRPFREALDRREICRRVREGRGTRWSPALVDTFLSHHCQA